MDKAALAKGALRAAAPAAALLLAILILMVPVRLGQGFVPTPLLPLMVVFLFAAYDPHLLPAPVVFVLGLLHDVLGGGGIGVWASVYLTMQYLVFSQRDYLQGRVPHVVWLAFSLSLVLLGNFYWIVSSLLTGAWLPAWPLASQILVTALAFPVVAWAYAYLRARTSVGAQGKG